MAGGGGELGLAEGLDLARGHLDAMLEGLGEDRAVRVHAAELEHQRHRLHRVVARAAELERGAGARGDVAVARGVHDDLRAQRLPSALALADHARDEHVVGAGDGGFEDFAEDFAHFGSIG